MRFQFTLRCIVSWSGSVTGTVLLAFLAMMVSAVSVSADSPEKVIRGDLLLLIGAPGTEDYHKEFAHWGEKWIAAATRGGVRTITLGLKSDDCTLTRIEEEFAKLKTEKEMPLWVIMLGHGTFDGRSAKFNLPGPDLEPSLLATWLQSLERPLAVVNCSSCSAPFLETLAAPNRVIITSTNNGNEVNFSRFGGYLSESLQDLESDLDKDQQVSLLEAFLRATRLTEEFYTGDGRLATEHAALDDNGDARPVSGAGFDGIRPIHRDTKSTLLPDGLLAHQWNLIPSAADAALSPQQIAKRNELEMQVNVLRNRKSEMTEEEYYAALEPLFIQLAKLLTTPP